MTRTLVLVSCMAAACGFHANGETIGPDGNVLGSPDAAHADGGAHVDGGTGIDSSTPGSDASITPPTCTAGATQCSGRVLQTCNGSAWETTTTCDFTCASISSAATCVSASNTSVATACGSGDPSTWPALDPGAGGMITYSNGGGAQLSCTTSGGSSCGTIARSTYDEGYSPGVSWFCLSSLTIESGATLVVNYGADPQDALGIIVDGSATIAGAVTLDGSAAAEAANPAGITGTTCNATAPTTAAGPGGFAGACEDDGAGDAGQGGAIAGAGGKSAHSGTGINDSNYVGGGGGGGGDATAGAAGGQGENTDSKTADGGAAGSTQAPSHLIGGGGGGGGADSDGGVGDGWAGGGGGGAIQISARGSIAISSTAAISAKGGNGFGMAASADGGGGGGGGGEILLEAPVLSIMGAFVVDGGNGGMSGAGAGGAGATGDTGAQPGTSYMMNASTYGGGGGGGGGGRILLSSAAGTACTGANVSPNSACTASALAGSAD